jgi:response regulator of citrate/malate metabolism
VTAPADPGRAPDRILIVEDDPAQARLHQAIAASVGLVHVGTVGTASGALTLASQADIVLLDHRLTGEKTGLDVLREIRQSGLAAAVVLVTAHGSEHLVAEALRLGATDYVVKDERLATTLPEVLRRVVRVRRIEQALRSNRGDVIRVERTAAIREVVIALSHELNSPLQALATQLEMLRLAGDLPETARATVAAAQAEVARITGVLLRAREFEGDAATTYVGPTRMTDLRGR